MSHVVKPREQAYLDILQRGLVMVRNFAYDGKIELCQIEADHLHNIPTLLHEGNKNRHVYYILQERGRYLERLRELGQVSIWSRCRSGTLTRGRLWRLRLA